MAKNKAFAPHDLKLGVFLSPWFTVHAGTALRTWEELVNDGKSVFAKHPSDFRLCEVGEFDDLSGKLIACEPKQIATALEYLKPVGVQPGRPQAV